MLFSKRVGHEPIRKSIQFESMDEELRNRLWNCLDVMYWSRYKCEAAWENVRGSNLGALFVAYWHRLFKEPLDDMPHEFRSAKDEVRTHFFKCRWNQAYDLIEFTVSSGPDEFAKAFVSCCNTVLASENAGYRILDGKVTPITDEHELTTIDEAIQSTSQLGAVREHLRTAVKHMSDRENPDYRNSIKESISAVEAACQHLTGDSGATLGKALGVLEKERGLHGALKRSFDALYGYTSDADGIRHALSDEPGLTFVDAKYMLVVCSAFINYLLGKSADGKRR